MLFSLMAMFLLSGHAAASEEVLRAEQERDMAELLRIRLDMIALQWEQYRDGSTEGEFPARVSDRLLDEEKVLADRFPGYRWEFEMREVVAAGAEGRVEIEGGDVIDVLFPEEGGGTEADEDELGSVVQPDEIDKMLYIRVTIYPPDYEEEPAVPDEDGERVAPVRPRSAWTAIHLPAEESEEEVR
jgi:hypothetical protein